MTENKRYSFNWKSGHPNFWDNHCDLADCYLTCGDVVNILNELNDENEQLKQQKDKWKQQCIHFKEMLDDMDITYLCDEWIYEELKGECE